MRQNGTSPSCLIFLSAISVFARVLRDLSAVGKTPKKSYRQKLQLHFPGTIPRHREVLPCSAPPGVLPTYPLTFLWGKFLHPFAIGVPLQIENALSKMDLTTPSKAERKHEHYVNLRAKY